MNKRAKWQNEVKSVLMWEDRAQGDCKNLDDLEKSLEQALTELQDGAVIIFQVISQLEIYIHFLFRKIPICITRRRDYETLPSTFVIMPIAKMLYL